MTPFISTVDEPTGSCAPAEQKASRGRKKGKSGQRRDWAKLPGQTVEVWLHGVHVIAGVVEQAAEDGSVLWIAGSGASTRRLFDKASGYQMWT